MRNTMRIIFKILLLTALFVTSVNGRSQEQSTQTVQNDKHEIPTVSAVWVQKIIKKIKANLIFSLPSNILPNQPVDPVDYALDLNQDGSVRKITKINSSNIPGYDEAVEKSILQSQPFPALGNEKIPSHFIVRYRLWAN